MPADEKAADTAGKRGAGTVREAGVAQEETEGAAGAERADTAADGARRDGAAGDAANAPGGEAGGGAADSPERDDAADATGAPLEDDVDGLTVRDAVSAPDALGRPRRVTRRFPLFTRDTARPEGGGRAAPGDAPAPARQWPVLAVAGLVGIGLLLTALDVFRYGTLLVGLALLGGAALRWFLPDVGMLAVRSRFTDIATYGFLGLVIVLLALMAQPDPLLEIPFLKDTLHFTVSNE